MSYSLLLNVVLVSLMLFWPRGPVFARPAVPTQPQITSPTAYQSLSPSPTATATATPTSTPSVTPSPSPTATVTATPTSTPSATPLPSPVACNLVVTGKKKPDGSVTPFKPPVSMCVNLKTCKECDKVADNYYPPNDLKGYPICLYPPQTCPENKCPGTDSMTNTVRLTYKTIKPPYKCSKHYYIKTGNLDFLAAVAGHCDSALKKNLQAHPDWFTCPEGCELKHLIDPPVDLLPPWPGGPITFAWDFIWNSSKNVCQVLCTDAMYCQKTDATPTPTPGTTAEPTPEATPGSAAPLAVLWGGSCGN